MAYVPSTPPAEVAGLSPWLAQEVLRIASAMAGSMDVVRFNTLHVEPKKPRDGDTCVADGTDWNPGSGAGLYQWRSGAWVFIG